MREWFQIKVKADEPKVAEIQLIDFIGDWIDDYWGFGVTAKSFIEQLSQLPDSVETIRVHINSPGGDVFSALNIANALRDQRATKGRRVETIVDGLAASSASLVLMAGDPVRISDNAIVMVHNPWSVAVGSAEEMRKSAEVLDKVRATIVSTYQWKTSLEADEIVALLDAETWMDASEAVEKGFADEVIEGLRAAASLDPRAATRLKVPEKFSDRVQALLRVEDGPVPEPVQDRPQPAPEPPAPASADAAEVVRLCAAAGLDLAFTQALMSEGLPAAAAVARITTEQASRAQAEARANDIRALCATAGQDDLAPGYVAGGMAVNQVRDHLTRITAKLDRVEIDSGLGPDHGTRRRPVIDVVAVYAERNRLRN